MKTNDHPSSFKDPSGTVFIKNGEIYRNINLFYKNNYDLLIESGLYNHLVEAKLLIPHQEIPSQTRDATLYKIIKPYMIPFISYPYEWSFSMLKDAALNTLSIQKTALNYSLSLKDATPFNIQFYHSKPIFIDTLSFEKYKEGLPWVAYRQFCESFLAPLVLMVYKDVRLSKLLLPFLGSIPLDIASKLLPVSATLNPAILINIKLHAASQKKWQGEKITSKPQTPFSRRSFLGLIDNLENTLKGLHLPKKYSAWSTYYTQDKKFNYDHEAFAKKKNIVHKYLKYLKPKVLYDFGANTGVFSRLGADEGIFTLSIDGDHDAVETNYQTAKANKESRILPLWIDLTNPTPSLGFENRERASFEDRMKPDTILALALIHHLALGNNIPLVRLARFFADKCNNLIIEFVPREDDNAATLINNRTNIFHDYHQEGFEKAFGRFFKIKSKEDIPNSKRIIYLLINKL